MTASLWVLAGLWVIAILLQWGILRALLCSRRETCDAVSRLRNLVEGQEDRLTSSIERLVLARTDSHARQIADAYRMVQQSVVEMMAAKIAMHDAPSARTFVANTTSPRHEQFVRMDEPESDDDTEGLDLQELMKQPPVIVGREDFLAQVGAP